MLSSSGRLHLHGLGFERRQRARVTRAYDKVKYRPLYADQTSILLENTAARPRVSVVGEVIAANGATTAARLHELAGTHSGRQWSRGCHQRRLPRAAPPAGLARYACWSTCLTRIVVQADLAAPGYVILADRFDDAWRAYVDDAEVPLARANGVERLVAVPAGSHVVRLSYAPFPIYLGLGISVVAVLAWLGAGDRAGEGHPPPSRG